MSHFGGNMSQACMTPPTLGGCCDILLSSLFSGPGTIKQDPNWSSPNFSSRKWKTDFCALLASFFFFFFQVNFQLKRSTSQAAPKRRIPNSGHRGRVLPKKVQPQAARQKEPMMKQPQRGPAWNPQCPGQRFGKALFLLSHQKKHSFYFIIWDIFKYKHIQNNSEWFPSVPRVNPLMH